MSKPILAALLATGVSVVALSVSTAARAQESVTVYCSILEEQCREGAQLFEKASGLKVQMIRRSTGETFSIGDPREAWIMEMIGPGPGGHGAHWVARRVPDGYVSCHANLARIREFPLEDPENCLYSPDVVTFATERGYWNPAGGEPFRFADAYCPATPQTLRYTATRVWSMLRRSAPSQEWSSDYHRGVAGAQPYPLWIKPDAKLTVGDVFAMMRDHYEGTPYDMTQGVDAGPYGCPVRPDPMGFTVAGANQTWERPISTKKTGFSMVSQCRAWLPDPVGGLYWYGVDDTYTTCYVPLYCGIDGLPEAFATGSLRRFSWDSAWWVFNLVANWANLRWCDMIVDIRAVQTELEDGFLRVQPAVEKTAVELSRTDPGAVASFLTDYSVRAGETVVVRWRDLAETLITKYNDGYVQSQPGQPEEVGYPAAWLKTVTTLRPGQFALPSSQPDSLASKLPY